MKFVIATGGSGGHLFPSIQVAQELNRQGHAIVFLGSFERAIDQIQKVGLPYEELNARGFVLPPRKGSFGSIIAMIKAAVKAFRSLKKIKPDVVLGFGGYGAFPVMFCAVLLNYPTLIHEQNVVPGRANALLSKLVKRVTISFAKSIKYFNPKKTVLTGCPCHFPNKNMNRMEALKGFHLEQGKTTLLIFGGSQGSQQINEVALEALRSLKGRLDFQVIHISGKHGYHDLQSQYNQLGIPFALFEFLDKMKEAYCVADLVISRSGAVTVSEIASFQLPAIFIPYPYAQGHQRENASVLCETRLSRIIEDKDLSASKLTEQILELLARPLSAEEKADRLKDICFPDATQKLAQEAVNLRR